MDFYQTKNISTANKNDLATLENTNLEQLIWKRYSMAHNQENLEILAKIDSIIFEKSLEQIDKNELQFWNGASMVLNYFCHYGKQNNNLIINELAEKIIAKFWDYYQKDPIKLTMNDGTVGVITSLCNCYRITKNHNILQLLESVANDIKQLKKPADVADEYLNIFPIEYERGTEEISLDNSLSWNSGNLSMALLMYNFGLCLDTSYTDWAYRIIGFSTIQTLEKIENKNNSITTGILGNAVLYDFFSEVFNEPKFKIAANYWLEKAKQINNYNIVTKQNTEGMEYNLSYSFVENSLKTGNKDWAKLLMIY
jgi:Lanthionine synthetase C-like protein